MSGDPSLLAVCAERRYPGRGLVLGRDAAGVAFGLYWLTGRSAASQLRRILLQESSIVVQDLTQGPRDDLRHYTAAHRNPQTVILGNGTHVSDLWAALKAGEPFDEAHQKIAYEPDPPIYTPRITGVATLAADGAASFITAGAVSDSRWPGITQHKTLHIAAPAAGQGQLVTTYAGDIDNPKPHGTPSAVTVESGWESLASDIWDALDPERKVAVTAFPLESRNFQEGIVKNKNV